MMEPRPVGRCMGIGEVLEGDAKQGQGFGGRRSISWGEGEGFGGCQYA